MKKRVLLYSLIFTFILIPFLAKADDSYPRLANYYLRWNLTESEAQQLAKWNLVILDMENQENNPELIREIRQLNPKVKILAYITSQEIISNPENYDNDWLRRKFYDSLDKSWFLKDASGNNVVNWPGTVMLNLSASSAAGKMSDAMANFVCDDLKGSGLWDGVFYDNIWGDVSWVNGDNMDVNNDGVKDSISEANTLWAQGTEDLLKKTRSLCGNSFLVMGNGRVYWPYQNLLNGMMLENFPSSWENGGSWSGSMETYSKLPQENMSPETSVINIYDKNQEDYQRFRYGLTSALLGQGYYSFDYDVSNHGQTWWYDEYNVKLGAAQSSAYNLIGHGDNSWQPGLWRRDFDNGSVIVNSTDKKQNFLFSKEEMEKIKGKQDPSVNNGKKINYISLAPKDGVILLKKIAAWTGSAFTNGSFLRVFDAQGYQARNGFFSYVIALPSGADVIFKHNGSGNNDYYYSSKGDLSLQVNDKNVWSLHPFSPGFRGQSTLALADLNGNGKKEIIIGAGPGGGPQVLIYSPEGKLLSNFFAYDPKFRGGINISAGDLNGDGKDEIITGAGVGGGPQVRIFDSHGRVLGQFFAYNKDWRGGVSVTLGDLNGDGKDEIITGPGPGSEPWVRYFDDKGHMLKEFLAYDKSYKKGIRVSFSNSLGQPEIAVGIKEF